MVSLLNEKSTERMLLCFAIAISAYIGSYIRFGMQYYKIWHIETDYTIMYTQILGSFIMGFIIQHRSYMFVHSTSRFYRILYTAISSGLCGSITTFSSWSMECNKSFYLQWDLSSFNNYIGSYNGGRFLEWLTCMLTGIAVPLVALHCGQLIALLTPYHEERVREILLLEMDNGHNIQNNSKNNDNNNNNNDNDKANIDIKTTTNMNSATSNNAITGTSAFCSGGDNGSITTTTNTTTAYVEDSSNTTTISNTDPIAAAADGTIDGDIHIGMSSSAYSQTTAAATATPTSTGTNTSTASAMPTATTTTATTAVVAANVAESKHNNNNNNNNNTDNNNNNNSSNNNKYFITYESPVYEVLLVAVFVCATVLVLVLPTVVYPTWIAIMYTGIFGVVGAYLRYLLSDWNTIKPSFPLGTFTANISGTWLLAAFTLISKVSVDYYDTQTQAVLLGLTTGFCGCLTTVSTFVSEIDKLPKINSYIYGITSELVAQFGIIFILNIYSAVSIPESVLGVTATNMCAGSTVLCQQFLININCSQSYQINIQCDTYSNLPTTTKPNYNTYVGVCACGNYSTNRHSVKLIDGVISSNISANALFAWPNDPNTNQAPTEVMDYCVSYQNLCDFFMIQSGCPPPLRQQSACNRLGILHTQNLCSCGSFTLANTEIQTLLSSYILDKRKDMVPYTGYLTTTNSVDFCQAFVDICEKLLDHFQTPPSSRTVYGCSGGSGSSGSGSGSSLTQWVGQCTSGSMDVTATVANHIYDKLVQSSVLGLFVLSPLVNQSTSAASGTAAGPWDACASYHSICSFFLTKIACPLTIRTLHACNDVSVLYPYGLPQFMVGTCVCGKMNYASLRTQQLIVDTIIAQSVADGYEYIPYSNDAYSLTVASSAFKQLIYPECTVPNA